MIKLRIDVDYPYPQRTKSFLYVALGIKNKKPKNFLRNARIIATMINQSAREVKATWFFTPYTIPDKSMLELLNPERHEVALHVANNPKKELIELEKQTGRKIRYFTIHGTSRRFGRIVWHRYHGEKQVGIPDDFPLQSFHDFKTISLDTVTSHEPMDKVKKFVFDWVDEGFVISMHPEWLFKGNKKSRRGAYYEALKNLLDVDTELETVSLNERFGTKIARDIQEYQHSVVPTLDFISKLAARDIDIFTFIERKWCCPISIPSSSWKIEKDNIALLEIKDYATWWNAIGKKTRNMVRKAEKSGITVKPAPVSHQLAKGIWTVYNETPIRQERAFPHFGEPLETVKANIYAAKNSTFIAATIDDETVGFIQILFGEDIAIISNILSMQKHSDKSINNAMLAKAVEICSESGNRWLMYGRIGNHPSLDKFKQSNGFVKYSISRFYIPISRKGKLAITFGIHQELKDSLPQSIKDPLIPVFNWLSRERSKLKLSRQ